MTGGFKFPPDSTQPLSFQVPSPSRGHWRPAQWQRCLTRIGQWSCRREDPRRRRQTGTGGQPACKKRRELGRVEKGKGAGPFLVSKQNKNLGLKKKKIKTNAEKDEGKPPPHENTPKRRKS
eukprot:2251289-Rhodomonas_salina.1